VESNALHKVRDAVALPLVPPASLVRRAVAWLKTL
jgi:hypothetical protein